MKLWKKLSLFAAVGLFAALPACNTVEGMEEDAEETGENMEETYEDVTN